ncbi:hypothetical protein Zmor_019128 [Zophobas morio]|jgi:hypothetical protein|uniref:Uncharacterized protein n=1 Tax=Zophobas morio TaxID=2755281 RepID=A0AA38HIX2_9CUCU|nr:hypothetical protein Zmor_019128 [Zophobas morio]
MRKVTLLSFSLARNVAYINEIPVSSGSKGSSTRELREGFRLLPSSAEDYRKIVVSTTGVFLVTLLLSVTLGQPPQDRSSRFLHRSTL